MTTIAFDGEMIVADSQYTVGDKKYFIDNKIKTILVDECTGYLCMSGVFCLFEIIENFAKFGYFQEGEMDRVKVCDDIAAFLVVDGKLRLLSRDEQNNPIWIIMNRPMAIGSGGDIALGVMLNGGNAEQAVKIASQVDLYTGGKLQKIKIKGK